MKEVIAFDEMTYQDNEDYKLFLESIKYSFRNTLKMGHNHLFTTDANGLYDTFWIVCQQNLGRSTTVTPAVTSSTSLAVWL